MEKNEVKKSKYLKVYTRSLANYLIEKGYFAKRIEASTKDPKKLIWFYERTPELERLFEEYINKNKSKTSTPVEDANK